MAPRLDWLDVEDIGYALAEKFPDRDPFDVNFPELRELVEGLDGFDPDPDRVVNEKILEAIQQAWHDEREDLRNDEDD